MLTIYIIGNSAPEQLKFKHNFCTDKHAINFIQYLQMFTSLTTEDIEQMLHTINIVIVCIVMSQSYRHGCMHGYVHGYMCMATAMCMGACAWLCAWPWLRAWLHAHAHGYGYGYRHACAWPQLQSTTSNNGTGTFLYYTDFLILIHQYIMKTIQL